MKKILIQKIFAVLKVSAFYLEISSFLLLVVASVSYCIYCRWYVVSKTWLNFTGVHLGFIEGRGLNFRKIMANLCQG